MHAKASKELTSFARKYEIPVVHTLLGLGGFPPDDELFLGMGGMHGSYTANMALYECDLLINIGARFDDRLTGNLAYFAKEATVAHIDIDPAEIGKMYRLKFLLLQVLSKRSKYYFNQKEGKKIIMSGSLY